MSLLPDITKMLLEEDIGGGRIFKIRRRTRTREKGRLGDEVVEKITAVGTIQPAGVDTLQQLPEADRSGEVIIVRSLSLLQLGRAGQTQDVLADEIEYAGGLYKILQLKDWGKWGMWVAYATRVGDVIGA